MATACAGLPLQDARVSLAGRSMGMVVSSVRMGAVLGLSDETQGGKRAGRGVGVDPVCRRDARLAVGQDLTVEAEFRARKSNRGVGRLCILRRGGTRDAGSERSGR